MVANFQRFISQRVKDSTFACLRCGKCCRSSDIILSNREIRAIATHLNISISELKKNT